MVLNRILCSITFRGLEFKPGLIPTLTTAVFLYLLVSLGLWQLDRAEYKENLESIIDTRFKLSPVDIQFAPESFNDRLYLPVILRGKYDVTHHIYLDNRVVNHIAGFDIYTPLILENGKAILVNRGWLKQGRTRQNLPEFATDSEFRTFTGILALPPSPGLILSSQVNDLKKWPAIMQYIDIKHIESALSYSIDPMILILDSNDASSFHQEPIKFNTNSTKHTAYAIQWFALAVTLSIIYLVVNTRRLKP
ncbi:MAG TPA: SURF1 family protein [Gammaproteobacteria bacterium]